jgi:hypothetical protein
MRKRAARLRLTLVPGGEPVVWTVPNWVELGSAEWEALFQDHLKGIRENLLAPGCDMQVELVGDYDAVFVSRDAVIRFSAVRRDTNSLRVARWAPDPERTPR